MKRQCPKCGSSTIIRNGRQVLLRDGMAHSYKQRYLCKSCGHRPTLFVAEDSLQDHVRAVPKSKIYVITAAQNATPVHQRFLDSLVQYCEHRNAKLVIVPFRYQNPTSVWSKENQKQDVWVPEVLPYLYDGRQTLNDNLVLLGDIKVIPTAVYPLTGFESITKGKSAILAHTKLQFRTVAAPQNKLPKILTTTGACTLKNYTDTKAGKKGEHHHIIGACVVEIQNKHIFHLRQINAQESGEFYDLEYKYTPDGWESYGGVEALVMGDTHVDFVDEDVIDGTLVAKDSIKAALKPKYLVWHDLLDFYSRSHHHTKRPFTRLAKSKTGRGDVQGEVKRACKFVDEYSDGCMNLIVPSNHNDHFTRWIEETDWRLDLDNAEFYLETALEMARNTTMTDHGANTIHPFSYWADKLLDSRENTILLDRDESFHIADIELGMHGDVGPNGSRGSIRNLSIIGVKSIIGHSHSPGIQAGCYQVGTSSKLRLEYNRGASSWLNTHCVIYPNGKRTLVTVVEGSWRV